MMTTVQMLTGTRLNVYTYQHHHKRSHQSHRFHPCCYPQRPGEDFAPSRHIHQQMLQVRDAEDVGELDVSWREELHDIPPYEASILPNRVTACASGWKMRGRQSPSAIIGGFVILSWDCLCPIDRWRSSIGCIHRWPIANASRLIPQWQRGFWLWVLRFWCRQEVCVNIVLNVKRQWLWMLTWCDCALKCELHLCTYKTRLCLHCAIYWFYYYYLMLLTYMYAWK